MGNRERERRHSGFGEPQRRVTITLPKQTVERLNAVDSDLSRAIVNVTETSRGRGRNQPPVEIVEVAPGMSVFVVAASRVLRRISWLRLIEIAPSRFLLMVVPGTAIESLELTIDDLVDRLPEDDDYERKILVELRHQIRKLRQSKTLRKAEVFLLCPRERMSARCESGHSLLNQP